MLSALYTCSSLPTRRCRITSPSELEVLHSGPVTSALPQLGPSPSLTHKAEGRLTSLGHVPAPNRERSRGGLRGPHQTKGKELQKRGNKSLPTSSAYASDISGEGEQPRCREQPHLQRRCSAPQALGAQDTASPM